MLLVLLVAVPVIILVVVGGGPVGVVRELQDVAHQTMQPINVSVWLREAH